MTRVCIEGWRGVNHSIAMVNQHQILALLDEPDLELWHRDLPYFMKHWNRKDMNAGFSEAEQARIDAVPTPTDDQRFDSVLRVSSPFLSQVHPSARTLTFMVTEVGMVPECFDAEPTDKRAFTREGNKVITPSGWARDRLTDYDIDPEGIVVVPHGVKADTFAPLTPAARAEARRMLGVEPDEVLFLNVGVSTWNKGLDLLIRAFAQLRQRGLPVRLLLKDHKALYNVGVERTMADLTRKHPGLLTEQVLAGVSLLSGSLDQSQMCALYGVADAYVSPYRAEGFNLPALEAMACGTPLLVTDGGATDDFCALPLARRIASRRGTRQDEPAVNGEFLVPDLDDLVLAMTEVVEGRWAAGADERERARQALLAQYSWPAVAHQLRTLL